jgi:hypothetical protein
MSEIPGPLTIDFLAWLAAEPRDYADVMEAWRTSCPRLTVWEDAIDAGLITRTHTAGRATRIELTARGQSLLQQHNQPTPYREETTGSDSRDEGGDRHMSRPA